MKHLGDPDAALVVDETGFLKQGSKSVGVQRQYSGTAGKIENCRTGVFPAGGRVGPFWIARSTCLKRGRPTGSDVGKPEFRKRLAERIPDDQWERLSAGEESKGPGRCDWGRVLIRPRSGVDQGHWLLVRRSSITDPEALACYLCYGAAETPLAELVRVAGARWIIEAAFKEARPEVSLDECEVRPGTGWYRHITPALLVHAFLAATQRYAAADVKGGR